MHIKAICKECGDEFSSARRQAGYRLCMPCGEDAALTDRKGWTVAPMAKSNYMLFTDKTLLKGLNKYSNN